MNINDNAKIEKDNKVNEGKQSIRDTLYGRIDVSVKTMDKIIVGSIIALIISVIAGVMI